MFVVVCCDSCVDLVIVFDIVFGDVFVVWNVVNLVLLYMGVDFGYYGTCVAVEYSVAYLEVLFIVVMGYM